MNSAREIQHELKQLKSTNQNRNTLFIDYHMLAEILPKPPDLPIPEEPIFIPHELYNLTVSKYNEMKFCVENSSQTEISDISDFNELKEKLNSLIILVNEYPKQINRVKNATDYQIKRIIEEAILKIYLLIRSRQDNLAKSYTDSIERIRGACRTQLANTIAFLNGLISAAKHRDETSLEMSLRNRIVELESALKQSEFDMKSLQAKLKEAEEKYDLLNLEMPNIMISRNSSLGSVSSPIPRVTIVVRADAAVQVAISDTKQQSLEREIKNLLVQIDVLKSALSAVQSQVRSLNEQHDQSEQKLNLLSDQLNESTSKYTKLEKEMLDKDNELTIYKQKVKSSESRLNELLTSMTSLRSEKAKLESDYAINRDMEMKRLKEQLDELLKSKEMLENECNSLRLELTSLKQKLKFSEPSVDNGKVSNLREQALIAEIVRLRRDLNRLQEASESRIKCLKNRLQAFTEESFTRRTLEMKVSQLHTAALKYADQLAEFTAMNKPIGCDETPKDNGVFLLPLPPPPLSFPAKLSHHNTMELGSSLRTTLPPIVRTD
ncbi:unnamed protein product [Heterobilharzia americana]|nr:unnamed protein product [Heterobilharzia americana]